MARLHQYQGKVLPKALKIAVLEGEAARSPDEALVFTQELANPVVVKGQAHDLIRQVGSTALPACAITWNF